MLHLSDLSQRGATCLLEIQTGIAKEMWLESAKTWPTVMSNGNGKQASSLAEWPTYLYKNSMETGWDIARNCMEMTIGAQCDLSQLMHDQMSLLTNGLTKTPTGDTGDAVDKAIKKVKRP